MTRWEYYVRRQDPEDERSLDSVGQYGWELVSVVDNGRESFFYFKRPIDDTQEAGNAS